LRTASCRREKILASHAFSCRGPADKPRWRVGIISRRLFAINWADIAWRAQWGAWGQERWAYVLDNGIIGEAEALRWADEVWGTDEPKEDEDE
jgi:hypothetical protein